jgi:hypothetical protein
MEKESLRDQLRLRLALYRDRNGGRNPRAIELHPAAFAALASQTVPGWHLTFSGDGFRFDGVPILEGQDIGGLFSFIDG